MQKISLPLGEIYKIQRVMREARGEKVYLATFQAVNKPVVIHQFSLINRLKALAEIETAVALDHAHILRLYEALEDQSYCYLIYEPFTSDLAGNLQEFGPNSEMKVGKIAFQVMKAIQATHTKGIVHNRINLHNIVLKMDGNTGEIVAKLTVYSTIHDKNAKKLSPFSAPETAAGEITSKCDIWSLGVIMYALLCGKTGLQSIHTAPLSFPPTVTTEVQRLIKRMLAINPQKRPSAVEVLEHPWIQQFTEQPSLMAKSIRNAFKRLAAPSPPNPVKDALALFVLYRLSPEYEVSNLGKVFTAIDTDGDGELQRKELSAALGKMLPEGQVEDMCQSILSRGNGAGVTLSQFLIAATGETETFSSVNVERVFACLDLQDLKTVTEESCRPLLCLLRDVGSQMSVLALARTGELTLRRIQHLCSKA